MSVNHCARPGGIIGISSQFSFNVKVFCVFSLYMCVPDGGDPNEYTQYTIFNMKRKIALIYPKYAAMGFFPRDSRTSLKQPW